MTTSAAVQLSPLSCLQSHSPCRFFCNDDVACQSRRLASIVDTCKPVSALRYLEVDLVQTVGPLLCPHQLFLILLPWFRPTPGSATNCGSSVSKSLTKFTISCHRNVFAHTLDKACQGCEGPNTLYQKWQYREYCRHLNTNTSKWAIEDTG